jgi:hypothetical protein
MAAAATQTSGDRLSGEAVVCAHAGEAGYGSRSLVKSSSSELSSDAFIQWTGPEPMLSARIAFADGT